MLLRCIDADQVSKFFEEFHDAGGHFSPKTTAYKILRAGYYWPDLFKDAYAWARKCEKCALFAGKERLAALPLHPIIVEQPFMRWGIDFVGPINPSSSAGHKWILTATDYFTRWTEAVALREASENVLLSFYEDLITRFGVPKSLISDNALAFVGSKVTEWALRSGVYLNTSSNYYPQGNGLAESTNKNLIRIIKRTLQENKRDWHSKLKSALWLDRITPKNIIGTSPYVLVYGKEAKLPISTKFPSLQLADQLVLFEVNDPLKLRYIKLQELEEERTKAL
jgi:transposase InsO family protein